MDIKVLDNIAEIEKRLQSINEFADCIESPFPAHRVNLLLLWWKHFSSQNNHDFGKNRGRNFLGSKSWLEKPFFILIENNGSLIGFAPLFISSVHVKGISDNVTVLSFSPDSSLIFYQDFLVRPDLREKIIQKIFNIATSYVQDKNGLLFLGHIPELSPNIPFIQNEVKRFIAKGWNGGAAKNCWRGGIYPWNIEKLSYNLNKLIHKLPSEKNDFKTELSGLIDELNQQTSALLLFAATRKKIESRVKNVLTHIDNEETLFPISEAIAETFHTLPIQYPRLYLPSTPDELFAQFSSSKRYFYRRYMKKFISNGGSFETIPPESVQPDDIDSYIKLHLSRWEDESAAFHRLTLPFHEEMATAMAKSGYFRLFFASYRQQRIAALSCFDTGKTREFYYSGRTMNLSEFRAGKLLVLHSILDAIQNGFSIYDFGFGGDEYKFDFTNDYNQLNSFFLSDKLTLSFLDRLFPLYEQIVIE